MVNLIMYNFSASEKKLYLDSSTSRIRPNTCVLPGLLEIHDRGHSG